MIFIRFILFFFLFYSPVAFAKNPLEKINDFGTNPGNLEMFMHVPEGLSGKKPLVVVIHGCNQSAASISRISGWDDLADKYGFSIVYPQQKFLNNVNNCYHFFHTDDIEKDRGEAGSIKQMIDYAISNYPVDVKNIFVYGVSSGGAMATVMLADYPALFRAGAVVAGGPYAIATNAIDGLLAMGNARTVTDSLLVSPVKKQNPDYTGAYPKLIVMQGRNDGVVDYKNAIQLIRQWSILNQCDSVAARNDSAFATNKNIIRKEFSCKDSAASIIFYDINHLGHRLPVDPGTAKTQGGQSGLFATDIDFFSTYYIAKDMGLIPDQNEK